VIYLSSDPLNPHLPEKISQCPLPMVVVSQSMPAESCNLVMRDSRQAASLATRYLIERGIAASPISAVWKKTWYATSVCWAYTAPQAIRYGAAR
jgi:DNA-binding LacI/PurR family transcriptional regulator